MDRIHWTRIKSSLLKYGKDISKEMKQKLTDGNKKATGSLIRSIKPYLEQDDNKYFLYLEMNKYGEYVDSGRRPGSRWPPREAIRQWIRDKNIRSQYKEEQLAFLIQRKIGVRGVEPYKFIHLWYDKMDKLNDMIEDSAKEDLENNINELIKEYNRQ